PEHALQGLAELLRAANLAVERRAPVGPQQVEGKEGKEQQGRAEGEEREVVRREAALGSGVQGCLVRVAGGSEQRRRLTVERVHEVVVAEEKQERTDH